MTKNSSWLQRHTYSIHTLAFLVMILASLGLYLAAQSGSMPWMWTLIGLFAVSNGLLLVVK
jgi:hypothetical protein